jgi:hypothetical protein
MEEETVVAALIEKCWGGVNGGCMLYRLLLRISPA